VSDLVLCEGVEVDDNVDDADDVDVGVVSCLVGAREIEDGFA
jgi:hypothetical protein